MLSQSHPLKTVEIVQPVTIERSVLKMSSKDHGEILRFEPNGDIYVKGKMVTNDMEIVDGFREFLRLQNALSS